MVETSRPSRRLASSRLSSFVVGAVLLGALSACALSACAPPLELSVDLRTDVPRNTFDTVVTTLSEADGTRFEVRRPLVDGEAFERGRRVADFAGMRRGVHEVDVRLEQGGALRAHRRVRLTQRADFALTVTIDASCTGVVCEEPTPSCSRGTCVRMECGGSAAGACGPLSCADDSQCVLAGCQAAHCEHGGCVCAPSGRSDAGRGDAGRADAGTDAAGCECSGGQVLVEDRACGCGAGTERRTRECDGCRFGAFGDWAGCSSACTPGQVDEQSRACGPCGRGTQRRTRVCTASCDFGAWSAWSDCLGEGGCTPGATRTGCDPCGHEVCTAACEWGACEPRVGAECLRIRPGTGGPPGNHYRCCGTDRWQFCLDTCRWSAVCESCTECTDC